MRIALHATGEIGTRTGRILLAERDLTALGLYGQRGATEDRRTMAIRELTGFGVLATDDPNPRDLAVIAAEDGLSCVTAAEVRVDRRLARRLLDAGVTLVTGANLSSGIAETLAAHELAQTDEDSEVLIAWTEPGRPNRRGMPLPFPDPVGPRWGERVGRKPRRREPGPLVTRAAAPVDEEWAGAVARVAGSRDGKRVEQIVGVADEQKHLAAIALAAGALAVAEGAYPPGIHRPSIAASAYLAAALRVGLGVAAYTLEG
jgi:hypothetical protein